MKQKTVEGLPLIEVQFERSVELVRSLPAEGPLLLSYATAAKVYSYFKQAKFGPCKDPKPNFWDVVKKTKWEAWNKLGDMSQHTAMNYYVAEIKTHFEEFLKTADFQGKHCDFSEVVVRFCEAVDLPIPEQLSAFAKESKQPDEGDPSPNQEQAHVNGSGTESECVETVIAKLKANIGPKAEKQNGMPDEHGETAQLIINDASHPFAVTPENGRDTSLSSDDESCDDVYCDSMDPDEVSKLLTAQNGIVRESVNVSQLSQLDESPLTATPSVTHRNGDRPAQASTPNGAAPKTLPLSSNGNGATARRQLNALAPADKPKDIPARRRGVDRHHRSAQPRSTNGQRRNERTPPKGLPSEDIECDSDAMADALRNFDSSGSGRDPSDSGTDQSALSDTAVDDKILHALRRLHRDVHVVSERIAAIEYSLCRHRKDGQSWWEINAPPTKTLMFFLIWPVLVNAVFFYWRRRRRAKR